ncbi:cytochrome c553 [Paramagnetospirillum caucaseum]|uniref:Cytochrome c553 n=1 Tax=Paramagnetospirillum caucaseum TaxID=1244869 RepID=M3A4S6_9PROT|nr:c-type cytochrome [Paramagnetospirillum caucaseum]EME67853.1 cytochrome c553 [Paramagnetospirillum caucaseum]
MMVRKGLMLAGCVLLLGAPAQAADIKARVKEIVAERCSLCHGVDGEAATSVYPRLAAQNETYMVKQLKDFRDGRRKGTMNEMARDLTDEEAAGLAAYFSGKKPLSRRPLDADFAAVGKYIFHNGNRYSGIAPCASCHGEAGRGTEQLPRLAGQHPAYVEGQLMEFVSGSRTNDRSIMHAVATKLTILEMKAVSAYIGGLE